VRARSPIWLGVLWLGGEQGCDAHPSAVKHQAMGEELAAVLHARLGW